MACNCGCNCGYCGGIDCYSKPCYSCGCNTTSTTTTTTINPNCEPCDEFYDCECVTYSGDNIECYGLKTGDNLCDILQTIIENLPECKTTLPPLDCDFTAIATTSSSTTTSTTTTTTTCTPVEFTMTAIGGVKSVHIDRIISSDSFDVNWGDGTIDSFAAGVRIVAHTYSSPYTGPIKITNVDCDLSGIRTFLDSGQFYGGFCGGKIEVPTTELAKLTGLDYLDMISMTITGDVADLPRSLTHIVAWGGDHNASQQPIGWCNTPYVTPQGNTLYGNVVDLPRNLVYVSILGINTITGVIADLPRSGALSTQGYRFSIDGNNTLSGNIADLPSSGYGTNTDSISILGDNTVTGDIANIPSYYSYIAFGGGVDSNHTPGGPGNTVYGNIANLSVNVTQLWMTGDNQITGDIANLPPNLKYLYVRGLSTIYGDITTMPCTTSLLSVWLYADVGNMSGITGSISNLGTIYPNLNSLTIQGPQTISGNISGLSPTVFKGLRITCPNAPLTGNLSSLTTKTYLQTFYVQSQVSTISGDLNSLPLSIKVFGLDQATSQVITYTYPHTFNSTMSFFRVAGSPALTTAQINNLLADLNASPTWTSDSNYGKSVQLRGTPTVGPPDGLAAITGLQTKGVTVTITP